MAEGGFQVGELAKCYFPGGFEVESTNHDSAVEETKELLKKDNVVIFEGAFRYESFFVRVDILVKNENKIDLIEVKAKSVDSPNETFRGNRGGIELKWKSYLEDVAFQKYVVCNAFPEYDVYSYLMMPDKSSFCPTDGLNQKFRISKSEDGRKHVIVSEDLNSEDLSSPILTKISTDDCCDEIHQAEYGLNGEKLSFSELIKIFADYYYKDIKLSSQPSSSCRKCEFYTTPEEKEKGLKSGFEECWKEMLGWNDEDFEDQTVLDIWDFRTANKFIEAGKIKITDLNEDDISIKRNTEKGLSRTERQWLQIKKVQDSDSTEWIDKENLAEEMNGWTFPLHFIDFETTSTAIPFNKGRRPYEGIAFQFSHHTVYEDGKIEHTGEYLNVETGVFPNYEFIRALKKELENDNGTIFRYGFHENTYLNMIYKQLLEDEDDITDREELLSFIKSITKSPNPKSESYVNEDWVGDRNMVDMIDLVKKYYYDPAMKGSNSIKKVLPAILNSSDFLQDKYSKPIYGAEGGIPSLNFKDWQWIVFEEVENGNEGKKVKDPYKLLPKMFQDASDEDFEFLNSDEIRDGGAALTAYAKMQFEEMSDYERNEISSALLMYCELDTLAMVMIYEGWRELVG